MEGVRIDPNTSVSSYAAARSLCVRSITSQILAELAGLFGHMGQWAMFVFNPLQKVSSPDILKAFHQEDPKQPPSPVLKQGTLPSSPTHTAVFSGGLRHVSLVPILL